MKNLIETRLSLAIFLFFFSFLFFYVFCISKGNLNSDYLIKFYDRHCKDLFYSGLTLIYKIFQSGCGRELNAHILSAASLKKQIPDTARYSTQLLYTDTQLTSSSDS